MALSELLTDLPEWHFAGFGKSGSKTWNGSQDPPMVGSYVTLYGEKGKVAGYATGKSMLWVIVQLSGGERDFSDGKDLRY